MSIVILLLCTTSTINARQVYFKYQSTTPQAKITLIHIVFTLFPPLPLYSYCTLFFLIQDYSVILRNSNSFIYLCENYSNYMLSFFFVFFFKINESFSFICSLGVVSIHFVYVISNSLWYIENKYLKQLIHWYKANWIVHWTIATFGN